MLVSQLPSREQHFEDLFDPLPAQAQLGLLRPAAFAPPAPALLLEVEEGPVAAARAVSLASLDARVWQFLRDCHACLLEDAQESVRKDLAPLARLPQGVIIPGPPGPSLQPPQVFEWTCHSMSARILVQMGWTIIQDLGQLMLMLTGPFRSVGSGDIFIHCLPKLIAWMHGRCHSYISLHKITVQTLVFGM